LTPTVAAYDCHVAIGRRARGEEKKGRIRVRESERATDKERNRNKDGEKSVVLARKN
jgi:hypothetical protein